jgi:hypothetical protein
MRGRDFSPLARLLHARRFWGERTFERRCGKSESHQTEARAEIIQCQQSRFKELAAIGTLLMAARLHLLFKVQEQWTWAGAMR